VAASTRRWTPPTTPSAALFLQERDLDGHLLQGLAQASDLGLGNGQLGVLSVAEPTRARVGEYLQRCLLAHLPNAQDRVGIHLPAPGHLGHGGGLPTGELKKDLVLVRG